MNQRQAIYFREQKCGLTGIYVWACLHCETALVLSAQNTPILVNNMLADYDFHYYQFQQ